MAVFLAVRMVFLLVRLLRENKCEESLFRTQSTVHHAVFAMPDSVEWKVTGKVDVIADMEKNQLGELDDKVISFHEF